MRSQRIKGVLYGSLLSLLVALPQANATPPVGDFDSDGLSDLSTVFVNRDKKARNTSWTTRLSRGGERYYSFGVPADALIQGKFWGDGKLYPGVVYVSDAKRPLDWYLKMHDNVSEMHLQYGTPGDIIPTQGDLDCDGITDLTVVRNGSEGYKHWFIRSSRRGYQPVEELFGINSDGVAIIDTDGDGCAEKIAVRNDYNWFVQKFAQSYFASVQWGLPGDYPLLPQDINGDGRPDHAIVRSTGVGQTAYVRYSNGSWESFALPAFSDAVPFLGHFFEYHRAGFGWWQRNQNKAAALLPNRSGPFVFDFGQPNRILVRPDGTVIQPSESGKFGSTYTPPPTNNNNGGSNNSNPPANFGVNNCTEFAKFGDGRNGYKYRPSSSRGRKIMFHDDSYGRIKSPIVSYDLAGNRITNWGLFDSPEGGWRARAYDNQSPSRIPRPEIIVAPTTDGEIICVRIDDPTREQN